VRHLRTWLNYEVDAIINPLAIHGMPINVGVPFAAALLVRNRPVITECYHVARRWLAIVNVAAAWVAVGCYLGLGWAISGADIHVFPVLLAALLGWCTARPFTALLGQATDTLFFCFCEVKDWGWRRWGGAAVTEPRLPPLPQDVERNNGTVVQPFFLPSDLRDILHDACSFETRREGATVEITENRAVRAVGEGLG